jgi:hypothetical protein
MVWLAACSGVSSDRASPTVTPSSHATPASQLPDGSSPSTSSAPSSQDGSTSGSQPPAADGTRIRVTIGDTVLIGRLWDSSTARDLIGRLPLTITFSDFNNVEKIARLPSGLSLDGVPEGDDPAPGDIGYYAPSRDLVLYYGDVGYFAGIVRIGQFDGNVDAIGSQAGDFTATVELAN